MVYFTIALWDMIAFIGGTRLGSKWTWLDGSDFNTNVWYPGEPSSLDEECTAILYGFGNLALDITCDYTERFICEIPICTYPYHHCRSV
ncbi:hypothetical protein SNE40_021647 [Patella caerulea]|uniref:C-type lectin domain-containing protein n=1 Tax=Patella caerulea TaxID=87958 RepID=A0AAN8G0C9_PATCE